MTLIALFLIISSVAAQSPPPGFGPPPAHCRPLMNCNLQCPYQFRFGSDGCEICQCRSSPCINETAILPNVECDRTPNGPKCPSTHDCVVPGGNRPRPPMSNAPPPSPPPTPSPSTRGVCCIHVDFQAIGMPPPPSRRRIRYLHISTA